MKNILCICLDDMYFLFDLYENLHLNGTFNFHINMNSNSENTNKTVRVVYQCTGNTI